MNPLLRPLLKDLGLAFILSLGIGLATGVVVLGCVEHAIDNAADAASALVEDGTEIAH